MTSEKTYPGFTNRTVDDTTPIVIEDAGLLAEIRELSEKMGWTETQSMINALMSCSAGINREHGYSQTTIYNKVTYTKTSKNNPAKETK